MSEGRLMAKNLVVVESPAKAKTINKYLGSDYKVMASYGHIKDLPSKGLGVDVEHDFEPTYEVTDKAKRHVTELKKAAREAETIYIAAARPRGRGHLMHLDEEIVQEAAEASFSREFKEITSARCGSLEPEGG